MKKILGLLPLFLFLFISLQAATLDETLESLSGEAAESYVDPIVSAFGTNLNGGWFHWAPEDKIFGFDVELGFIMMGTMFPDEDKNFSATGSFQFTASQADAILANSGINSGDFGYNELVEAITEQEMIIDIHGATIVGNEDDHVMLEFPAQTLNVDVSGVTTSFDLQGYSVDSGVGGLLDGVAALPLVAPQLSIGTVYGTKASFRYMPTYEIPDVGDFDYFGFGIQHNPKAWLKVPIPVDLCASFFTQSMKLGDYVEANSACYGINVSKTFGMSFLSVTPYAGFMLEQSNMKFKYTYEIGDINGVPAEPLDVKFDIDGKNKSRLTLGTTFRLGVFNINADYNIGKYNSFTAGFALGF